MKTGQLTYDEYRQNHRHGSAAGYQMCEDLLRQELDEMVCHGELPSTNPCNQSITQEYLDMIAQITLVFTFPFWRLDPSRIWQTHKHASMGETMLTDSRTFEYAGK